MHTEPLSKDWRREFTCMKSDFLHSRSFWMCRKTEFLHMKNRSLCRKTLFLCMNSVCASIRGDRARIPSHWENLPGAGRLHLLG